MIKFNMNKVRDWLLKNEKEGKLISRIKISKDGYLVDDALLVAKIGERDKEFDAFLADHFGIKQSGHYTISKSEVKKEKWESQLDYLKESMKKLKKLKFVEYERSELHIQDDAKDSPGDVLALFFGEKDGDLKVVKTWKLDIMDFDHTTKCISTQGPFPMVFGDKEVVVLGEIDIIEDSLMEDLAGVMIDMFKEDKNCNTLFNMLKVRGETE